MHPFSSIARLIRRPSAVIATCILGVLLVGCGVPGVVASGKTLPPVTPTATAKPLPPLVLPNDEAPHKNLTEWWYYTGHLTGTDATGATHNYGFELTFFQVIRGSVPPIYIGHYAVTDLTRGEFHFDQRTKFEPNAVLPNGTSTAGFNLAIDDWTLQGSNGHDTLNASEPNYALNLKLDGTKPAALHNSTGLLTYGVGGYSYYYSRTNMQVAGTIQDHGVAINLTGTAWMDHQWGDFITVTGTGWDWFSVQMADNSEYMIYQIRDNTGKVTSVVGTLVGSDGKVTDISNQPITETAIGSWTSPTTNVTYPSGWKLTLPTGTITVTPLLQNQELVTTATTGNTYWEGACSISATINGQTVNGEGYTELTGYVPAK